MIPLLKATIIAVIVSLFTPLVAEIRNVTVTSGASFEPGLPAKGSIASVFCTGLEGIEGVISAGALPLGTQLAGVQVRIGQALAPLFAVANLGGYQQINLQVPLESQFGSASAEVAIEQNGLRAVLAVPLRELISPGDFFRLPNGRGLFQHAADYESVTPENAARAGEVVIAYLTGLPGTEPAVASGQRAPSEPLAVVPQRSTPTSIQIYRIQVNDSLVEPRFVGLVPGAVGLYQINFALPDTRVAGQASVRLVKTMCEVAFGTCGGPGSVHSIASTEVTIPVR